MTLFTPRTFVLSVALLLVGAGVSERVLADTPKLTIEQLRKQRRELAERPRQIIMKQRWL